MSSRRPALARPLAGALVLLSAACAATGAPTTGESGTAEEAQCSITPNPEFTRFQTDRDAVLEEQGVPQTNDLLVTVRDGQESAFYDMSVWDSVDGYEIEQRSGDLYEVSFENAQDMTRVMSELTAATDVVESVEYDTVLYPNRLEPNDPCYALQWSYWPREGEGAHVAAGGAGLPALWSRTTGARSVVVAVIDTGIAVNADNQPDNLAPGWDFVSNVGNSGDGDGRDSDPSDPGDVFASFHGTHVGGTVGSAFSNNGVEVASVNWQVSVQPIRVLGGLGGETGDIIDAVRWAAGLPVPGVPINETPARIINLSLGGPGACPRAMQDAVDDATAAGALVIAAAGNDARDAGGFSPSGCRNVFTVAAGDLQGRLARYSNFGASVELMAPGGDVRADLNADGVPDGVISTIRDGLANYNGTSMAAPHVAGVAALLLAQDPSLTPVELGERLTATAIPRDAAECPLPCGAGLLNAEPAGGAAIAAANP
jgi:serine protease